MIEPIHKRTAKLTVTFFAVYCHHKEDNVLFWITFIPKWFLRWQIFIKEVVNNADDIQMDEISNLNPARQKKQDQCGTSQHSRLVNTNLRETDISPPSPEAGVKPERNGNTSNIAKVTKAFEIQVSPNGKTQTSVKSLNKRKISQQKEKKATQMLAIVLGKHVLSFCSFVKVEMVFFLS